MRSIYNPWLSTNWNKFDKKLREDLLFFRDKLYGCSSIDEIREAMKMLVRLYISAPNDVKDCFMEMLKKTDEYYKKNSIELDFGRMLKQYKVTILVKDNENRAVKSAQITVMYNGREIWKGVTPENGKITLNLNEGKYTIFASLSEEEWYGLNIVELNVPQEGEEKLIIIRRHPRYETAKPILREGKP
ncbi:hypothetical protein [Candidatus Culexarchaeum yellowstonense]|uniref:hypothetical protein n=1 Tax=Candidatus Culexarchaeum yellowstonense TaxID=2928963 RepID=UPI0026E9BCC2|nr:hypothetical protein [Candidatus Culexarchaeum yellowstonense]